MLRAIIAHESPLDVVSFDSGSRSSFPTSPPPLDPGEIHENKITQKKPHGLDIGLHNSYPQSPSSSPNGLPSNFSRFMLLVSVLYTAHHPMHSAINCLQISLSLTYCFFLPRLIHSTKSNSCLFPSLRKLASLRDIPVALSGLFDLLHMYDGLRDALQ